jgi:hypothetical protein
VCAKGSDPDLQSSSPAQKVAQPLERRMEHEKDVETYQHPDGSSVREETVVTGGAVGGYGNLSVKQTHHAKDGSQIQAVNHYYRTPVLHGGHTGPQEHMGSHRQYIDPASNTWKTQAYGQGHDQAADADGKRHLQQNHSHHFSWPEGA